MASRGCALRELEQVQVLTELLGDENIGKFSFGGDCIYEFGDTQLVTQKIHVISGSDEQHENINKRLGGMSDKFV
jgi:hypothetical protein